MKLECSEDKFDRKKHFIPLTQLIENVNDESFVMTISASYGDGKTFFVNQWKEYLEKEGYKTLYYNAWENDTADNPLISFIANFQLIQKLISEEEKKELFKAAIDVITDNFLSDAQNISNFIALCNPPLGFLVSEGAKILKKLKISFKKFSNTITSKSFIEKQLQRELEHKKHIEALKNVIEKIIKKDSKKSKGKLIVFIDDLDRCNPQYTIKFLEYLKHVFEIPNCIFVLAVDELQLRSSIEVVYGNKNGEDFLAKLIDFKFKLPKPNIQSLIMYFIEKEQWDVFFEVSNGWNITQEHKKKNFSDVFNTMAKIFKLSARDICHICQDLNIIFKSHRTEMVSPTYILMVYLMENYTYKIEVEFDLYLKNNNFDYLKALKNYCSVKKYEIQDFKSNQKNYRRPGYSDIVIEFSSSIREYIDFLDYRDNFDYPVNQAEKFYALSPYDFDTNQCRNLYPRIKKIIQDIFELGEERKQELEVEEYYIREQNMKNMFYRGDGLLKKK